MPVRVNIWSGFFLSIRRTRHTHSYLHCSTSTQNAMETRCEILYFSLCLFDVGCCNTSNAIENIYLGELKLQERGHDGCDLVYILISAVLVQPIFPGVSFAKANCVCCTFLKELALFFVMWTLWLTKNPEARGLASLAAFSCSHEVLNYKCPKTGWNHLFDLLKKHSCCCDNIHSW